MLIATFNCNSIRLRLEAILRWLDGHKPDVLALQETKCPDDQFPADAFTQAGWHASFRGQKGYNGVAVITRRPPDEFSAGLGDGDEGLSESRLIHVRMGDLHVVNTYVPQGSRLDSEQFDFKLQWLGRLKRYFGKHFDPAASRLVWLGDLNVAASDLDVYDPKTLWPHVCFCKPVQDAFAGVLAWGLQDVIRRHRPDERLYTFFDYRMRNAVQRNLGWRVDHILATAPLAEQSTGCFVDLEPRLAERPSDHTFLAATFEEG